MTPPRLLVLSLGGTITMLPGGAGPGVVPTLGAEELVAAIPALAGVARIEAQSPLRLPSPSLSLEALCDVARRVAAALDAGAAGAVVVQGTDTIEESAFLLDLLLDREEPVVVTGAMRSAAEPGADGPANLLAAARVAVSPLARGLGVLAVLNDEIHAARFVRKAHTARPSAFTSAGPGPLGGVAEGEVRLHAHVPRRPTWPIPGGTLPPVALLRWSMGDDGRMLGALPGLGYAGVVLEGLGAGHVPDAAAEAVGALAARMPLVLASRTGDGPIFRRTYAYPGGEIDLLRRGAIPAGTLPGAKARLLLAVALAGGQDPRAAFAAWNG